MSMKCVWNGNQKHSPRPKVMEADLKEMEVTPAENARCLHEIMNPASTAMP